MALRAFKTTFLIAIDDEEARDQELRENPEPFTTEELKQYLDDDGWAITHVGTP